MYGYNFAQPPRLIGALAQANSLAEVQAAPASANGPTLFLIENSPEMYLVSLQNGQKTIQGFRMTPMPTAQEATESRLSSLEAALADIKNLLERNVRENESDTVSHQPVQQQ